MSNFDIFISELQNEFFKKVFQEINLKLCILQSGQRRKNINYPRRTSVENKIAKLKKLAFDENDNLPSIKILTEIKLDRILEGLIKICEVALNFQQDGGNQKHHWLALCDVIEEQQKEEIKVDNLEKDFKDKKLKFKELRSLMENQRIQSEESLKKHNEIIASLSYNLKNMHSLNQIELKLVKKWEENRYTQAIIVTTNAELFLKEQIQKYQQLYKAEKCRLQKVEKFMALKMASYESKITEWQQKFSEKLHDCNIRIKEQEESIFDLRKTHDLQCETYKERVEYVNEYLCAKAAEQELLMQEIRRIESSVQIQAWWRGTMVRRGLGPFRKKSKKSKKSKK